MRKTARTAFMFMCLLMVITTGYSQSDQKPLTIREIKEAIANGKENIKYYKQRIQELDQMTANLRADYAKSAKIKKPDPATTKALNLNLIEIAIVRKQVMATLVTSIEGVEALESFLKRQSQ